MGSKRKSTKKKDLDVAPEITKEVDDTSDADCEDLSEKVLARLPHLANEMQTSETDVRIDGVRWEETDRTRQPVKTGDDQFSGYSPDVIDFIRRCATEDEAIEIINFLEKRGEINSNHAEELRNQLREQGIRSFGSQKSWGFYERKSS